MQTVLRNQQAQSVQINLQRTILGKRIDASAFGRMQSESSLISKLFLVFFVTLIKCKGPGDDDSMTVEKQQACKDRWTKIFVNPCFKPEVHHLTAEDNGTNPYNPFGYFQRYCLNSLF